MKESTQGVWPEDRPDVDDEGRMTVSRNTLQDDLWNHYFIERKQAKRIVNTFFEIIHDQLVAGNTVKLSGFGNFSVADKNARPGRNLKTNETVMIDARRVVRFTASPTLNDRASAYGTESEGVAASKTE